MSNPAVLGTVVLVSVLGLSGSVVVAQGQFVPSPVQQDPEDYQAVQQVCTVCHNASRIMHSRTWREWQEILGRMSGFGAKGSDQQWNSIAKFLLQTLTIVDVNKADLAEIGVILDVDGNTAAAVVNRRDIRPFTGVADLASVKGVSRKRLEEMKSRLQF